MSLEISLDPRDSFVTTGLHFRVIDVREDDECERNPIVSDYRIPFSHFDVRQIALPQDSKLLVICEQGQRSLATTRLLRAKGWRYAFSLSGGLNSLPPSVDESARTRAA